MTETNKTNRFLSVLAAMLCIIVIVCAAIGPVYAVPAIMNQGTNGDELNIAEAQKLEIQLGTEWSGKKFQLKTDVGLYPGDIIVDNDGILRLEIGGSKSYLLSCVGLGKTSTDENVNDNNQLNEESGEETAEQENRPTDAPKIQVKHIVIFLGGLIIIAGLLIAMRFMGQSQDNNDNGDE